MKEKWTYKKWTFLLLLTAFSACYEDTSCNQNSETGVNVTVENSGSDADTDLDGLDYNKVASWSFRALNDTFPFVSSESETYSSGIPLAMNDTSLAVLLEIIDSDSTAFRDTIMFSYVQTDLKLLSVNCGFAPSFRLLGAKSTLHMIDSVMIREHMITTDLQIENVAFYY